MNRTNYLPELISKDQVCETLNISKSTFYRLRAAKPDVFAPVFLTRCTVRYNVDRILQWVGAHSEGGEL